MDYFLISTTRLLSLSLISSFYFSRLSYLFTLNIFFQVLLDVCAFFGRCSQPIYLVLVGFYLFVRILQLLLGDF